MEFPHLEGNPLIDNIIHNCWHNKYVTVSELAAHTTMLLYERNNAIESKESEHHSHNDDEANQNRVGDEFLVKKEFCQDLVKHGLLRLLSSGEPEQIGFTFNWYRYSLSN